MALSQKKERILAVDLRYTREQLLMLFIWTRVQAVNRGGRYEMDVGIDYVTITVWTTPQVTDEEKSKSMIMGALFVVLTEKNRICEIEVAEDYTTVDMLHELAILEAEALGRTINGKWKKSQSMADKSFR